MTTQVIDGLKARSYGFKKSIEEKEGHIKQVEEGGQRYYPPSNQEGIDEWGVFPRKIGEFNQQVQENQKLYKQALRSELNNVYENQKSEKQKMAEREIEEKKRLGELTAQQDYQYKVREQAHTLEVRDLRRNFDDINKREEEVKRMAKEEEARRLEEVQNSILLEEDMRKEKLKQYRSEVDAYNKMKDIQKEHERNMSEIEKEADRKRIQSYIDNEIRRNQAYNEHYSMLTHNQINMQNQYLNQISPVLQQKYSDAVRQHQDAQTYQQLMAQRDQNFQDQRKQVKQSAFFQFINGVYEHNKERIVINEHDIARQRDEIRRQNQEVHSSMIKDLDDYQRRMKDDKMKRQLLYRETLNRQKETQEYEKKYYGNMSRREKEFNREDLRAYKQNVNDINCMIPGIRNIPSVGTRPLRGGDKFIKMQMDINSTAKPQQPGVLQTGHARHETISVPERSSTVEPKREVILPPTSSQMIGWRYDQSRSKSKSKIKGLGNSIDNTPIQKSGLYNPITNPLPGLQQNPYLRSKIATSNMGTVVTPTMKRSNNIMMSAGASILDRSAG